MLIVHGSLTSELLKTREEVLESFVMQYTGITKSLMFGENALGSGMRRSHAIRVGPPKLHAPPACALSTCITGFVLKVPPYRSTIVGTRFIRRRFAHPTGSDSFGSKYIVKSCCSDAEHQTFCFNPLSELQFFSFNIANQQQHHVKQYTYWCIE